MGAGPATAEVVEFIDQHRESFDGVEPICRTLRDAGVQIAPSTYYQVKSRAPAARALRDEELIPLILKIYKENYQVCGARKIWQELHRQGHRVARCTVERLMCRLGIRGVSRGRVKRRTTVADRAGAAGRPDLLGRDLTAPAPNLRWVADFTYVPISMGTVYAAFIVDCFSRFIVGWRLAGHMRTDLPLDALELALWQRDVHSGQLVHHSDRGNTYLFVTLSGLLRLARLFLLVVKVIRTTTRLLRR